MASFKKAVSICPESIEAQSALASAIRLTGSNSPLPGDKSGSASSAKATSTLNDLNSLIALKQFPKAIQLLEHELRIDPQNPTVLNKLGTIYKEQRKYELALERFDQALALTSDYLDALINRGISLIALHRLDQAVKNFQHIISLYPSSVAAYVNLGVAYAAQNQAENAIAAYKEAQKIQPDCAEAYSNESFMHLLLGDFNTGWRLFEWRWQLRESSPYKRETQIPRWTGKEPIRGKTVYLHCEQGLGDRIQFLRYITLLESMGATAMMAVPDSLHRIVEYNFPNANIYHEREILPHHDFYCPLLSLPLAFKTRLDTIPGQCPYLRVPPERIPNRTFHLEPTSSLKIGLVWSGNPVLSNDANRSISLETFDVILHTPGVQFYALQQRIDDQERALLTQRNVPILGDYFGDFVDTAAAIAQLDLVISVDTSVAHLVGALGKPLWLLLPFAPDWRWLLDRTDSPWYPSARLFRQTKSGSWDAVLEKVRDDLLCLPH